MPKPIKIIFITADGKRFDTQGQTGTSVMELAIRNNIPGIEAECGGACSCATCHVYAGKGVPPAGDDMEIGMLEATADERRVNSRLSCQVFLSDDLDGAEFTLPETQL